MKNRFNEQRNLALRDPLCKRALQQDPKVQFELELDGHSHLGPVNVPCERECGAVFFKDEVNGMKNTCCNLTGNGSFKTLQDLPDFMKEFLDNPEFRNEIRNCNCAFQIAHLGSSLDHTGKSGICIHNNFPFHIRIHGQLCHSIPPVRPKEGASAKFAQICAVDNALEELCKQSQNANSDEEKMARILEHMNDENPWAGAIRRSVEQHMKNQDDVSTVILDFVPNDGHKHRVPKEDTIAGFVPTGRKDEFQKFRHVKLDNGNGTFSSISELNVMCDPAHCVLMFLNGKPGCSPLVEKVTKADNKKECNSMLKFCQQRLHMRPGKHCPLGRFGRLFHQCATDMWIKIKQSRLQHMRDNDKDMRCLNSPETRADDEPVGKDEGKSHVHLPRSFTGGPRHFWAKFLNAINAANAHGAGTLLVTMTTNPDWPEIKENLAPGETARDRPDLVARVFHKKWKQLKDDLTKHHVLGFCIGCEDVHEFQKNGLPHGHIIIILHKSDQPRTPEDIDRFALAELPDKATNREEFNLVTKHMLHECKKDKCPDENGVCRKGFPMPFRESTVWHGDQRMQCRRRRNGRTFIGKKNFVFDNRHVVPHNVHLLKKHRCHLNVLVCSTKIAAVWHLFGCINKGVDMATLKTTLKNDKDEIEMFVNGRCIAAPEACHKLFGFEILNIEPTTVRLPVHLEGQKWRRTGRAGGKRQVVNKPTELEAFFTLNKTRLEQGETDNLHHNKVSKHCKICPTS